MPSAGRGHQLQPWVFTCCELGCKPSQVPLGGTVIHSLVLVSVLGMVAWFCISFRVLLIKSRSLQVSLHYRRNPGAGIFIKMLSLTRFMTKNPKQWYRIPISRSWICRIYRPHVSCHCAGRWGSCRFLQ